ncbi:MAG: FAD-binding oxidoreductase, partial [Desulfobacterales bacterium]|nr:FAD-binding oxidoreductase [Desulfobacterales bacterium]
METKKYDVVIVGGGVMGCAVAYYLMKLDNALNVAVIEMDPAYERASSTLSMANARIQFSLKENVLISKYALETLERFEEEMAVDDLKPAITYRPEGNLFLVDEKTREPARAAMSLQKDLGGEVEWWSPDEIKRRFPMYETGDVAGGTFGARDGHFDAYAVLMGYKKKARSLGAVYLEGEVVELLSEKGRMQGVRLASGESL